MVNSLLCYEILKILLKIHINPLTLHNFNKTKHFNIFIFFKYLLNINYTTLRWKHFCNFPWIDLVLFCSRLKVVTKNVLILNEI